MTIYAYDEDGNMYVEYDSRWAEPELLGFTPDDPIYHTLKQMHAEYRQKGQDNE